MAHPVATVEEHPAPARTMHWLHVVSIILLTISGAYIAHPFMPGAMSFFRGTHIFFMWVLVIVLIARIIWAFVGRSAPLGSREVEPDYRHFGYQRQNRGTFWGTVKYYTFLQREAPAVYKYNTLQKGTYLFWALLVIVQAITGFALWSPFYGFFKPLIYAVGGYMTMRSIHYGIMWLFIITTLIHIYLSALHLDQLGVMFLGREPGRRSAYEPGPVGPTTGPVGPGPGPAGPGPEGAGAVRG